MEINNLNASLATNETKIVKLQTYLETLNVIIEKLKHEIALLKTSEEKKTE